MDKEKSMALLAYHALGTLNNSIANNNPDERYYPFISFDLEEAWEQLQLARECASGKEFLDVGCGFGNIMLLAYYAGLHPHGIEYNEKLRPYTLSPLPSSAIKYMDARRYRTYGQYDIVYLYCPIRNSKLEAQLEEQIESALKPGAIYICNIKQSTHIHTSQQFRQLDKNKPIWQKLWT